MTSCTARGQAEYLDDIVPRSRDRWDRGTDGGLLFDRTSAGALDLHQHTMVHHTADDTPDSTEDRIIVYPGMYDK